MIMSRPPLRAMVKAAACAIALTTSAAAEQEVAYAPGGPWAIVSLSDGCVVAVSTRMDEWEDGPGTFSWSGGCSANGYIEGPGTLRRQYLGRKYHSDGKVVTFEREWNMHATALNGLMHGVGEKSYGGNERDQFRFAHGCSQFPDGAGGWTPAIANCSVEEGEFIGQEMAKNGGPATYQLFKQLVAERQEQQP